mgnify:CR=1 FL=1
MGLHDGHGDDRVRVTHQLPRVDLLEHLAVLDLDGAARVLLLLQVDDGDALVAQLLIAALGNRQLRVAPAAEDSAITGSAPRAFTAS